jgi:hypothetical protein
VKSFLKKYFPIFVNVVQHLRDFGRFEMNKRDLGRQRKIGILVGEEEIPLEIQEHQQNLTFEVRQNYTPNLKFFSVSQTN